MTELTRTVLDYQQGKIGLQPVFRDIAPLIYYYPIRSCRGREDECGEFLLFFYHRLIRLLQKYTYSAKYSFEGYLFTSMRYQYSTFILRKSRQLECTENPDLAYSAYSNIQQSSPDIVEDNGTRTHSPARIAERLHMITGCKQKRKKTIRKRITILVLMNLHTITIPEVEACARAAEISVKHLQDMIDRLKKKQSRRLERLEAARKRRNQAYVQLFMLQQKIQAADSNDTATAVLREQANRMRLILDNARKRIRTHKFQPLHHEIAEVMDIPKGSVHSSISYLRELAARIDDSLIDQLEASRSSMVYLDNENPNGNQ